MDIRNILNIDMAGKLSDSNKRYEVTHYIFDYLIVNVSIYLNTVSGSCYSNAPYANLNNSLIFYKSKKFGTYHEAWGHAEMEIGKAMKRFPKTKFTLSAENPDGEREYQEYQNGKRLEEGSGHNISGGKLCYCGARFEGKTCPKCGEWHLD